MEEMEFISANADELSVEAMAETLNRDPVSVRDWVRRKVGFNQAQRKEAAVANELRTKPYYQELSHQFSPEELEMFEFHFKKMWSQFKDDVFHTEEMQIIDAIKLEILMNRALRAQQENQRLIQDNERVVQNEKMRDRDQQDIDLIVNLERQIAVLRASQETLSKDYKDLQTRKASALKDLKGTREQRIKELEDSKETFGSLVKQIAMNEEFRTQLGLEMEKMRIATQKEVERLSDYTTYEDGMVDQPFFTPDTVLMEKEK